ncbi:hypothetical protein SPHV1_2190015 [Novosphingobium sp. KN65.2]|nr:hypothetical protein SPHV1_2190015 [Novosphingobium sp. KN65.2]
MAFFADVRFEFRDCPEDGKYELAHPAIGIDPCLLKAPELYALRI